MPSLKLELRTWRHFDDAAELIEATGPSAETPLQRAAARRVRENKENLDIVRRAAAPLVRHPGRPLYY